MYILNPSFRIFSFDAYCFWCFDSVIFIQWIVKIEDVVFCEVHTVKILGFVGCMQSVLHILLCFVSFFSLFSSFCPFLFSFFSFLPPSEHMKTILRLGHTKSTSRLERVHLLWLSSPWYQFKTAIATVLITGWVLERLAPNF